MIYSASMSSPFVLHTACTHMHISLMHTHITGWGKLPHVITTCDHATCHHHMHSCHMSHCDSFTYIPSCIYTPIGHQSNQVGSLVHSHMVSELWNDHLLLSLPPSLRGVTSPLHNVAQPPLHICVFYPSKETWRKLLFNKDFGSQGLQALYKV